MVICLTAMRGILLLLFGLVACVKALGIVRIGNDMRTAEAVRNGHPDKVCDIIADALLDAYLARDPNARVAIEVQGGHGKVTAAGEVTTREPISFEEIQGIIQHTYEDIGYQEKLRVETLIAEQSGEIAAGVDTG